MQEDRTEIRRNRNQSRHRRCCKSESGGGEGEEGLERRCRFHGSQSVSWHPHCLRGSSERNTLPYTLPKWFQLEPERCEARKSNPSKTSSALAFGLRFAQIPF